RQVTHPGVHGRQVDPWRRVHLDAELGETLQTRPGTGGRDERLGRNTVVQHTRATKTVTLDDGDVGSVLRRDQCRLVAGRSAAHDHDLGQLRSLLNTALHRQLYVGTRGVHPLG